MMVSNAEAFQPPHDLALVIDFVNTLDVEAGADALIDARGLGEWLAARDLLDPSAARPGERERRRALGLREALRALMLAHNGAGSDERPGSELERAARDGHLGVHFGDDGSAHLDADGAGFERALARLLIPVVAASADGSWERVKACRADDCMWAFYDRSRNRSGVWCDMAVCGNRTKVRAFRQRAPKRG
jgi:predicted RNA-binding Zn ribbon-like protein